MSNTCTRCGKERIVVKKWIEATSTEKRSGKIIHMMTSCPDPECQKAVNKALAIEKQKNEERSAAKVENERVQREERQKRLEESLQTGKKK